MTQQIEIKVGDNRAEAHFHFDKDGKVVVDRIFNLDHGIPIHCATKEGSAFDTVAAAYAAIIEGLKAA
jgi:hypothetical protein